MGDIDKTWYTSSLELPYFRLDGRIAEHVPFQAEGSTKQVSNPWIALGNAGSTVALVHATGEVQLGKGADTTNSNRATLTLAKAASEDEFDLLGSASLATEALLCQRYFGCGFAEFHYVIGALQVIRNISVRPAVSESSADPDVVLTIKLNNTGGALVASYLETLNNQQICLMQQPLKKGEAVVFQFGMKLTNAPDFWVESGRYGSFKNNNMHCSIFESEWRTIIPKLTQITDSQLRQELQWNAYVSKLVASANIV
jgi:hypothetical protein